MERLIRQQIHRFVLESRANRFADGKPFFEAPLVGFARTKDPLFTDYKRIIGDFHLTPDEIMQHCRKMDSSLDGTVICWVLPICQTTRQSNRRQTRLPSPEWAMTREYGENFNNLLRHHLVKYLTSRGYQAIAPTLSEIWHPVDDPETGLASTWSERHAAYAAGLGTFSLNGGLITANGMAHRCGSIVTDLVLSPTPRPYEAHQSYCLYFQGGQCGQCIKRCPAGALTTSGHDKKKCLNYAYKAIEKIFTKDYGIDSPGCGLCQTGTPCEAGIPSLQDNCC